MKQTFNVLFLIRKTRLLKTGETPIQMRITVQGEFVEVNTQRKILPAQWNQSKERAIGKSPLSIEINTYLDTLRVKVQEIHSYLCKNGTPVNAQLIKEKLTKKDEGCKMFFDVYQKHNDKCEKLIDIDLDVSTVRRHKLCLRYFKEMYADISKVKDIPLKDITPELIEKFVYFLKTEKGISNNTVVRYMKCMKKIINMALTNKWIETNPFVNLKFREEFTQIRFLTMKDVEAICNKEFTIKRLEQVRDIFIFCCYTGLAFIDVWELEINHIVEDENGKMWIRKPRKKTGVMSEIPLLNIPLELIEKYKDFPDRLKKNKVLPVISNQKLNSYLKEIADLCGIKIKLSMHCARHTFATTITLANHVRIENVSRMLGHTNLRRTQLYAKVLDASVMEDMMNVNNVTNKATS